MKNGTELGFGTLMYLRLIGQRLYGTGREKENGEAMQNGSSLG